MKIEVKKPFIYYIDGCYKKVFQAGIYDVPEDCAKYAKSGGFLDDPRTSNAKRSKSTMQS